MGGWLNQVLAIRMTIWLEGWPCWWTHGFCERDNSGDLDKAIEKIVDANGPINGKDVTRYLEGYKTEMWMMDIPVWKQLSSFARVVASNHYSRILEKKEQAGFGNFWTKLTWGMYGFDDSFQMTRKDLMYWVDSPTKVLSINATFHEFEQRFGCLSALYQTRF